MSAGKHTPGPMPARTDIDWAAVKAASSLQAVSLERAQQEAVAYCKELRRVGLEPTVPRLMRRVRGLLRSQAEAAIAKAAGAAQ